MARAPVFDPTADDFAAQWQRLDFRLLQNGFVYRADDLASLNAAGDQLAGLGYLVHRLDAGGWLTEADLHEALAAQMSFPAHYGRNLDALNDVLRDVAAFEYGADPASTGTALLIERYDRVDAIRPGLTHTVLDIVARRACFAALLGHPMLLVVELTSDPGPVGATSVSSLTPLV